MSCHSRRRKCRCCKKFFSPDSRNKHRQIYCSAPPCRQASKRASQRRWRRTPSGRDYFRGKEALARVQQWRRDHPGYWKKHKSRSNRTQPTADEPLNSLQKSYNATPSDLRTLQDFCLTQEPAFVGLISMVTGSTLQEDIAATSRNLLLRGLNILGLKTPGQPSMTPSSNHEKTPPPSGSPSPGS